MSRIITNTNIIVDDFDFCKSFPRNTFIHFLTHFHSDHYQGLSPLWDYGEIHCSDQTKKFLIDKYPKLKRVHSHQFNKWFTIELVQQKISVEVVLFDAKHIPGSAMILFKGYMGTILFTGDFRYQFSMISENPILFPPRLRSHVQKQQQIEQMKGISIQVDEMIFDNTYCNQFFKFETESFIAQKIIAIIEKNRQKKLVYIAMGALGKHKILMKIGEYFQTSIVVAEKQLKKIALADLRTDFLTTNPEQGFIHLISKKRRAEIVQNTKKGPLGDSFICIDTDFLMLQHQSPDQINYIVPYSLHSNFKEMETLIRSIQPCILRKIVIPYANFKQVKLRIKIDHRAKFAKYLDFLESKVQKSESGYSYLVKSHTQIQKLSKKYLKWFYPQKQKELMSLFGIGNGQQNHQLRKRKPVLLDEEELSNLSRKSKPTLKSIADQLNAANKNHSLERAFTINQESKINSKYSEIFNEEDCSQKISSRSASQRHHDRLLCRQYEFQDETNEQTQ